MGWMREVVVTMFRRTGPRRADVRAAEDRLSEQAAESKIAFFQNRRAAEEVVRNLASRLSKEVTENELRQNRR